MKTTTVAKNKEGRRKGGRKGKGREGDPRAKKKKKRVWKPLLKNFVLFLIPMV